MKAPKSVELSDLVLGYPYAPSEVVVRRDWAFRVGLFDDGFRFHGEDPDFFMRLALAGCVMKGVDRALSYRRRYRNRALRNFSKAMDDEFLAFDKTFTDSRCPRDVLALRQRSKANLALIWSYLAFCQNETSVGQTLLQRAIQGDRTILDMEGRGFLQFLLTSSIRDGGEHESIVRGVFRQLPAELAWLGQYEDATVARACLVAAARDTLWDRGREATTKLVPSREMKAPVDQYFRGWIAAQLLNYQSAFGSQPMPDLLSRMSTFMREVGARRDVRWLKGEYFISKAFRDHRDSRSTDVIVGVLRAVSYRPIYIGNRGVMSILARSIVDRIATSRCRPSACQ
jgi:hypothetical protein